MEVLHAIVDALHSAVVVVNTYMSDYILLVLLLGVGLFYTIKTRFVQVRCFGEGMKRVFGGITFRGGADSNGMSSFQALATAVAAQVGTGNIVGACGAILVGGPGAIFWMWIIAFFGMATIYAEAVLAQQTKERAEDGSVTGGPAYYIRQAFKGKFGKFLAGFFAVSAILALGVIGPMIQSNAISDNMNTAFGIPTWVMGIVVAVLAGFVFIGGVSRLASVTEKIVPIMAAAYILGSILVLILRIKYLPEAVGMIFKFAFKPNAIIGGSIGYALKTAISLGAKRGLFSNEAGMGSTPHAHAIAKVEKPHDQGVAAMIGVFLDTFVVLTLTALVVITILYANAGPLSTIEHTDQYNSGNMAQSAFAQVLGTHVGNTFIALCLFFFAFSTIISWNLFGRINFNYLFGKKATVLYSIVAIAFTFMGAVLKNEFVWDLQDMFNQFMVLPNVIALIALSGRVMKSLKEGEQARLQSASKAKAVSKK